MEQGVYSADSVRELLEKLTRAEHERDEWKRRYESREGIDGEITVACSSCFDEIPNYATGDPALCEKCREIKKLRRELKEAVDSLDDIAEIIETVDNRCAAVDGPVSPTLSEMTQAEISRIYELAKRCLDGEEGE